jgi:azurin
MKSHLFIATVLAALVVSGCGQKDSSTTASAPPGPRETAIDAKPGEDLKVVLTNIGTQPKEVMGHNWVLLKAGTDVDAFVAAAITAKDSGYIPASLADEVIAHIDILGPRKSGEADFKAPMVPGDYPFLCTFPAHYQSGMKGVLTVK